MAQVFAFSRSSAPGLVFSVSDDGRHFEPQHAVPRTPQQTYGKASYGFWNPVLYTVPIGRVSRRYLRIEFTDDTQIGRVEVEHADINP